MIKIISLIFTFTLFYSGAVLAVQLKGERDKQSGDSKNKGVRTHLKTVNIEKKDFKADKFVVQEGRKKSGLNNIDFAPDSVKKRIVAIKNRINTIDENVNENIRFLKEVEKKYELGIDYASRRIVALYKLHCLGRMHVILSSESVNEILRGKTGLEFILASDKKRFKELELNSKKRLNLTAILSAQKKEKIALKIQLKKEEAVAAFENTGSLVGDL